MKRIENNLRYLGNTKNWITTAGYFCYYRQHIIDETGDHFLVVEENAETMTSSQRKVSREQILRSAHYMQGKGKYYGTHQADELVEPIINVV